MRNNIIAQERGRFCSPSGSAVKTIYSPMVRDDGVIELVPSGKKNTDEEIQSYAASCSLENILARYRAGDTSVLNVNIPQYLDLTEFPKTYAEVLQLGIDAEVRFNGLPIEIKRKYDNNWRVWLAQTGSEQWFADLGISKDKEVEFDPVEKEVADVE